MATNFPNKSARQDYILFADVDAYVKDALQTLSQTVETLTDTVEALEARVTALEAV
jgi:hypothetical protein